MKRFHYHIDQGDDPEIVVQERLTLIARSLERIADSLEDVDKSEFTKASEI